MPQRRLNITPDQLANYRPVPGYKKVSFFDLATGQGRSSRRYYNPSLPVNDPNREIADSTYFRLMRQARQDAESARKIRYRQEWLGRLKERNEEQVREAAGYVPARDGMGRIQRNSRGQIRYTMPSTMTAAEKQSVKERYARMADVRQQVAIYNYQVRGGGRWLVSDRMPGGYLSNMLEELGWRPREAPWMVGESGMDHSRIAPNVNPDQQMSLWKSQSPLRTGAA